MSSLIKIISSGDVWDVTNPRHLLCCRYRLLFGCFHGTWISHISYELSRTMLIYFFFHSFVFKVGGMNNEMSQKRRRGHKKREILCKRLNKRLKWKLGNGGSWNKRGRFVEALSTKLDFIFETLLIQNSITCSIQALNLSVTVKAPLFVSNFAWKILRLRKSSRCFVGIRMRKI